MIKPVKLITGFFFVFIRIDPLQPPASSLQPPASSLQPPASSLQPPASNRLIINILKRGYLF